MKQFIPVSEDLPENNWDVIVLTDDGHLHLGYFNPNGSKTWNVYADVEIQADDPNIFNEIKGLSVTAWLD